MRRFSARLLGCCAFALWFSAKAAAGESRMITVDEAVALAIGQNAALQAARARLQGGQAAASSTGRHLAPAIHLSDEFQHYNSAFIVPMGASETHAIPRPTCEAMPSRNDLLATA